MGGGSWATALAKLLLSNRESIIWYMRRPDRIDDFCRLGHNPAYLSDIPFDVNRIAFTSDINLAAREADTLLLVTPSPYFLSHFEKLTEDISGKGVVSAIKGMVPGCNSLVSHYMESHYGVAASRIAVIGGPCHSEEVALGRHSYLTIGCACRDNAEAVAGCLRGRALSATVSTDVAGLELAAVMKNIYAIAAGIVHGLKSGDNFLAVLVSNAIREMQSFITAAVGAGRDIDASAYVGDLLVTCYSNFSRNHNFGSLIGRGYSVKAARMEMEQTAEGYYGAACIHAFNESVGARIPLADAVYDVLYRGARPSDAMRRLSLIFD